MSENEEKENATVIKIMEHPAFDYFVKIIRIGIDAETKPLKEELKKVTTQRDNLLCRIHRDGGHYIAAHGIEKACADADSRVATLNVECENLRSENQKLKSIISAEYDKTCVHHTDAQRKDSPCPVCCRRDLEKVKGERERCREALRPFVEAFKPKQKFPSIECQQWFDQMPGHWPFEIKTTMEVCRQAKRVLGELGEGEK